MMEHISRPLAIKALGEDGTFAGYASVFDTVDSQNEAVARGAFARTLAVWRAKNDAPAMLWMHDPTAPIGVWLSLHEDESGLVVRGRLALSTQKGREAYELLKMRALTGLSIGYRVIASRIDKTRKARVLTNVDLFEISLVTFPANEQARVHEVKAPRSAADKGKNPSATRARFRVRVDKKKTRAIAEPLERAARKLRS